MRNLNGFLVLARHAFWRILTDKRTLGLVLLGLFPPLFAYLQITNELDIDEAEFVLAILFIVFQTGLPIAALVFGVAVMGDEIEGRTVTFLFTRPLPRPVVYLGRLTGHAAAGGLLVGLATLAAAKIYTGRLDLTTGQIGGTVAIAVGGLLVYVAFFAALRLLFRRALFIGFILAVIFEGWVSKMPVGGFAQCSVWHHLAVLQLDLFGMAETGLSQEGGALIGLGADESPGGSLRTLIWIFVVCVGAGAWLVRRREIRIPAAVA